MFNNIGKKIKGVATVFCWIGIVFSCIGGIALIIATEPWDFEFYFFFVGILAAGFGSLMSWLGSLALYGFGELIDKATEIARNTAGNAADTDGEVKSEFQRAVDSKRIARLEELRRMELITEEEYKAALAKEQ